MKISFANVQDSILDIKEDKRTEVFNFGKDNAYPSLIETLIDISVTSKTCVDRVAKAIYGGAFGKAGDIKVNSKKQSLNEVLRIAAREYAKHNNCYIHVGFNGLYEFKSIKVIPVTDVRLGKADDLGYSGKFVVYDNWDKEKGKKIMSDKFQIIDRFNPNTKVVKGQIEKAGGIKNYNGQIIHIKKDDNKVYSLSDLNTAKHEALLEYDSQLFRSQGTTTGFMNTKLLAVPPFANDEARKEFKRELKGARGAKNSGSVILLESAQVIDDLSKALFMDDLSSPYNDKLLEYSDVQSERNICKAFSVPLILVSSTETGLFGNSGEMLKEAKSQLFESRKEDRDQIQEAFETIIKKFEDTKITTLEIVNPFEEVTEEAEAEAPKNANAEAQAQLRGSVGGVTALLAIQQSVALGTTDKDAGVAIIVNIFGFSEDEAISMLGNPKPQEESNNTF